MFSSIPLSSGSLLLVLFVPWTVLFLLSCHLYMCNLCVHTKPGTHKWEETFTICLRMASFAWYDHPQLYPFSCKWHAILFIVCEVLTLPLSATFSFSPTSLLVFSFPTSCVLNLLSPLSIRGCRTMYWSMRNLSGSALLKKTGLLPQQPSAGESFSCPCWDVGRLGLVPTVTVSSCVQTLGSCR